MKRLSLVVFSILIGYVAHSQTLTFLFKNGQLIAGPKFQFEVWVKSSDGTSRMGSILVYNNYGSAAFGQNVVAGGRVSVTKNSAVFGATYGLNASNDNTANRFAYSWTYLGGPGSGVVIPATGDGVLAFTVQIDAQNTSASAALSFQGTLMDGEQYKDDETTAWPLIDATSILDDPLPVQLVSFTATIVHQRHIRLDWRTLSEVNNYGFHVQRKQPSDSLFIDIPGSFVPGHGTTNEPHEYFFTDSTSRGGLLAYRLKQTDLDGSVHYSDPISVELPTGVVEPPLPTVFSLAQNYPNPFNPGTTIAFSIPRASTVVLKVYNVLGHEVETLIDGTMLAGHHSVSWDATIRASGVYFCRFTAGPFAETRKLLLMK